MDLCPQDDDPATCPPCRRTTGRDPHITRTAATTVEFGFTARYDGECGRCHLPIYPGQPCAQLGDGRNVHQGCA